MLVFFFQSGDGATSFRDGKNDFQSTRMTSAQQYGGNGQHGERRDKTSWGCMGEGDGQHGEMKEIM